MTEETPEILHGIQGQFFFQGKFFDESQEDDFWKFVSEWPNKLLDQDTAESLFRTFSKGCIINTFISTEGLTNGECSAILADLFYEYIRKTRKNMNCSKTKEK